MVTTPPAVKAIDHPNADKKIDGKNIFLPLIFLPPAFACAP